MSGRPAYIHHVNFPTTDPDGNEHVLHYYRNVSDSAAVRLNPGAEVRGGGKWIETADGMRVTRRGKGDYLVDHNGLKLVSDHPDAP